MSKPEHLRLAVIGCGFFAQNHLNAWAEIPEVTLVAVCDQDATRAEAARAAFGAARAYTDAAAMMAAEELDFVDIATTMHTHLALVALAAQHGVHVVVQKPLAPNYEDCLEIARIARDAEIRLMVHENFRFQSPVLALRAELASGRIGKPHFAQLSFRSGYDVFTAQPYLATDDRFILIDLGIHILDMARAIMGEAETLYCSTQHINPRIRGEDVATCLLRHANGGTSIVDCSYASWRLPELFPQTVIRVEGERGVLELTEDFRLRVSADGAVEERPIAPATIGWATPPGSLIQQSVLNTQRHWVESWRAGTEPETSGRDNLRTYGLVMAAYESAARNAVVEPAVLCPPL